MTAEIASTLDDLVTLAKQTRLAAGRDLFDALADLNALARQVDVAREQIRAELDRSARAAGLEVTTGTLEAPPLRAAG